MAIALADIAHIVNGSLTGDGHTPITGVGSVEHVREGEITFIDSPERLAEVDTSAAAAFIAPPNAPRGQKPMIVTEDPRLAFSKVLELFAPEPNVCEGVHPTAVLGEDVELGDGVSVGAHAVVGDRTKLGDGVIVYPLAYIGHDVEIGEDSIIYPQVYIGDRCSLGARVGVHAGTSIGGDGFGYAPESGGHRKIPQIGTVIIADDVEIGANATIDRATVGATKIGAGTKIDDHVHVAHNVQIGVDGMLCGQVGISGSATIGDRVILAGQVGVNDHIEISSDCVVGGQAGVFGNLEKPGYYSGYPAKPHNHSLRVLAATQKLPALQRRVRELEKLVEKITAELPEA